jgi:hypothetical protein
MCQGEFALIIFQSITHRLSKMKHLLHTITITLSCLFTTGYVSVAQGTSNFNGTVFNDLNGNGLQDSGEEGISGVLVELRGGLDEEGELSSSTPQAAALSGPDGSYSFHAVNLPDAENYRLRFYYPTEAYSYTTSGLQAFDNYVRTSSVFTIFEGTPINSTTDLGLQTVYERSAFSTVKELSPTNWGFENLYLPKSPTGYGTLQQVKLYINYHVVNPEATITNTNGTNSGSGYFQTSAVFRINTPFDEGQLNHTASYLHPEIDLTPSQSIDVENLHSSLGGQEKTYSTSFNPDFVGSGNFAIPTRSNGASAIVVGSGNVQGEISTLSGAGIFVVYIYESGSLPVTLASFTGHTEGELSILNWTTTEETNSANFEVERSGNGKTWSKIGTVSAKGESSTLQNYSFPDARPLNGTSYYRLKMNDNDGSFDYSPIVSLRNLSGKAVSVATYPNPTSDVIFLENIDANVLQNIEILNTTGRSVLRNVRYNEVQGIDVRSLSKGLYLLKYTLNTGEQATLKFFVNR